MDTDGDLSCDTLDPDDDNDTILDGADIDPLDPTRCQDLDGDTCDDCSVVQPPDIANDGVDTDADGLCDAGDTDADGDDYSNDDETTNCVPASDPLDPASTPVDTDGDLICDTLDPDNDNDTILSDGVRHPAPLDPGPLCRIWMATPAMTARSGDPARPGCRSANDGLGQRCRRPLRCG